MPRLVDSLFGNKLWPNRHEGQQSRRRTLVNFRANGQVSGPFRQCEGSKSTTQVLTDSTLPLIYVRTLGGTPRAGAQIPLTELSLNLL